MVTGGDSKWVYTTANSRWAATFARNTKGSNWHICLQSKQTCIVLTKKSVNPHNSSQRQGWAANGSQLPCWGVECGVWLLFITAHLYPFLPATFKTCLLPKKKKIWVPLIKSQCISPLTCFKCEAMEVGNVGFLQRHWLNTALTPNESEQSAVI